MFNPYEPNANNRSLACANYDVFRAHVDAGFTEEQAMTMVQTMLYSAIVTNAINEKGDN